MLMGYPLPIASKEAVYAQHEVRLYVARWVELLQIVRIDTKTHADNEGESGYQAPGFYQDRPVQTYIYFVVNRESRGGQIPPRRRLDMKSRRKAE